MMIASGFVEAMRDLNDKTPDLRTDFAAGRVRTAGGLINIVASGFGCFRISNPSGSGKVITIDEFTFGTNSLSTCRFWLDSTLTAPTNLTPTNPNRAYEGQGLTTVGVAQQAGSQRVGGTQMSNVLMLPNGTPLTMKYAFVLIPGQSVTAQVQAAALNAVDFYCNATWAEDPQ